MTLELNNPNFDIALLEAAVHCQFKRYDKLAFSLEAMVMRGLLQQAQPLERAKNYCGIARDLLIRLNNQANSQKGYPKELRKLELHFTDQLTILLDGLTYQLQRYEELLHFVAKKNDAVLDEYSCHGYTRCLELFDSLLRLQSTFKATPKPHAHVED